MHSGWRACSGQACLGRSVRGPGGMEGRALLGGANTGASLGLQPDGLLLEGVERGRGE